MIHKKFLSLAFGGLLGLFLALPALAQRGGGSSRGGGGGGFSGGSRGGGGGFSRPSSGGGGGFSRPSGSSGGSFSRPSGGGFNRSSGFASRPNSVGVSPQRGGFSQGPRTNGVGGFQGRPGNRSGYVYPGSRGNYAYRGGNSYGRGAYGYRGGAYGGYRGNYGRGYYGPRYFNRGFYNYRGYYNSYYLPRIGFSIGVLPFGYYPFYFGDYQYYYSDGLYYQQNNNQYTVVEPPVGAQINALPSNAQPITINGEQFYEANGVYYRLFTKDDGTQVYEVTGKDGELNTSDANATDQGSYAADEAPLKVGDIVDKLPQDSRKIKVNGEKLYVAPDGTYFQEALDEDNNKVYKVVGLPTDEQPADDDK
ncbi:hypothetical protein A0256_04620 [Mucilaginibacter sp. PAMC 26640]|nr:hypothetical protein A0256_04620 [Mucilaginibacter sp. PAMC 26640]